MATSPSSNNGQGGPLVAALAEDMAFSSRLSARSALYTDFRLLLEGRNSARPRTEYRRLVVEENCLARSSDAARKKIWKELRARYILDGEHPLFAAFWQEWQRCSSEPERGQTAFILFALNDRLVAELGQEFLCPLLRRAPADLRVADVRAFIERAKPDHPEVGSWSDQTKEGVAGKFGASVRDFGLAKGTIKKTTVRPALYGSPIRLLVRALRLAHVPDMELVQAPIFRLLAHEPQEVIDVLAELNRTGDLHFRMQGDVVELDLGRT